MCIRDRYGTARAELLCTCVASLRVQTLVACICRSACIVASRRRLLPYLESRECAIGLMVLSIRTGDLDLLSVSWLSRAPIILSLIVEG